jgi:hypothetical protein
MGGWVGGRGAVGGCICGWDGEITLGRVGLRAVQAASSPQPSKLLVSSPEALHFPAELRVGLYR